MMRYYVSRHFLLTGLWCVSASLLFTIHTPTHHLIAQLVRRPQDTLGFSLIVQFGCALTLHTKKDTARCCLLFFLAVSFSSHSLSLFLSHTHAHNTPGLSVLMRQAWDSCLRQCRCAWGYLGLWSAPLPGTRNSTVSSWEKKRERWMQTEKSITREIESH